MTLLTSIILTAYLIVYSHIKLFVAPPNNFFLNLDEGKGKNNRIIKLKAVYVG